MSSSSIAQPLTLPVAPQLCAMLVFNASNQLAVRQLGSKMGLAFTGSDLAMATARLESSFRAHTTPTEYFTSEAGGRSYRVFFAQVTGAPADPEIVFCSLDSLAAQPAALAPSLAALLEDLEPHL